MGQETQPTRQPDETPGGASLSLGYARVSTTEQSLESQQQQLHQAGCYEIYSDHGRSGATMARPELEACLRALQPGNTLVVTKLDRLGRTVRGLVELLDSLHERGVAFRSLTEGIDTTTPSGRLMFNIIASVAEMERELIRERTRAGLAVAKGKGGRPPRLQPHDVAEARRLREQEDRSLEWIAKKYKVSRSTIIRALRTDGLVSTVYGGTTNSAGTRETFNGESSQAEPN